jgi:hypothetical protein
MDFLIEHRKEIVLIGRFLLLFAVIALYFLIRPKLNDQTAKVLGYIFIGIWLVLVIWLLGF